MRAGTMIATNQSVFIAAVPISGSPVNRNRQLSRPLNRGGLDRSKAVNE